MCIKIIPSSKAIAVFFRDVIKYQYKKDLLVNINVIYSYYGMRY